MLSTRKVKQIAVFLLSALLLIGIIGCSSEETKRPEPVTEGTQEWIIGTISSISDEEILVSATSDSLGTMTGPVRVGTSEIDASVIEGLTVGDELEIVYSGIMGLSDPPFISAISLTVVE